MVLIFRLSPGEVIFLAKWNINLKSVQEDVKCNLPIQFAFPLWRSEWGRLLQKTCPFFLPFSFFLIFLLKFTKPLTPNSVHKGWSTASLLALMTRMVCTKHIRFSPLRLIHSHPWSWPSPLISITVKLSTKQWCPLLEFCQKQIWNSFFTMLQVLEIIKLFKIFKSFTVCQGTQLCFCHRSLCLASDSPAMSKSQEKHTNRMVTVTLALWI